MGTIRIAHISDPHFGSVNQLEVWRSARDFLNETIKPHLVLVTGDIVHTPDQDLYTTAREELDHLAVVGPKPKDSYRVCAGNHDRHPYGNAPGLFQKAWEKIAGYESAPAWFSHEFEGRVPTVDHPLDIPLSDGGDVWKVRAVGIDTSTDAKFAAQGHAALKDLQGLANAARGNQEADLVVLMHHHHLLAIKELEESRQTLKDLLKPTIMLNAGTVLEALAQGYVNVVLHGHEHFRMFARYGTLSGQQSDTVIIGAGSVTGNHSTKGCHIRRASFNVIELRPDRSVHVQVMANSDGLKWKATDPPIQLLDGRAIRRARFYRRADPASPPTSRIVKCVEFHADRTVDVTQSWTDWALSGRWATTTTNSSGLPSSAYIKFEWPQGEPTEVQEQRFVLDPNGIRTYRIDLPIGRGETRLARRIVARFKWWGGAVLTKNDLAYFDSNTVGEFRSHNLEFWTVRTQNELQSMSLLVRLPPAFAPKPEDVAVYCKSVGASGEVLAAIEELRPSVQHHALGVFSLEIPYPLPHYRYSLAWPIADDSPPSAAAKRFHLAANAKGQQLLEAYARVLDRSSVGASVVLGLYVPATGNSTTLTKTGELRTGVAEGAAPASLSLRSDNTMNRHAFWGRIQLALADARDPGFTRGERAVIMVPIRQFGRENESTWGLIRIGLHAHGGLSDDALLAVLLKELEVFADGVPMALQKAA
ncbi:metallophosphoesterase [Bradyrhizobium sp. SSUT77]|uniref:metallophosphoesterase family protein n=1 Tax=Bradyrhizobium sp. SSUT77 TaxID=3040603 RepID=UPI0024481F16|nr:metallophosphoesterase [Bradyrhizobium sp. SSUT77]MDH2345516.1 metallophosphoesterase [Bradyrhizobium sp. SSUT77]